MSGFRHNDRYIKTGFPTGWYVQDRLDEGIALLCRDGDAILDFGISRCICLKPRAISTDEWLPTARQIAHSINGDRYSKLVRQLNQFLEDWGDELDMDRIADLHNIIGGAE